MFAIIRNIERKIKDMRKGNYKKEILKMENMVIKI